MRSRPLPSASGQQSCVCRMPMIERRGAAQQDGSSRFDAADRDGINVKNAFERSATSGWVAGVAVPAVLVDAPLWHTALIMMVIGQRAQPLVVLLAAGVRRSPATCRAPSGGSFGMAAVAIAGRRRRAHAGGASDRPNCATALRLDRGYRRHGAAQPASRRCGSARRAEGWRDGRHLAARRGFPGERSPDAQ